MGIFSKVKSFFTTKRNDTTVKNRAYMTSSEYFNGGEKEKKRGRAFRLSIQPGSSKQEAPHKTSLFGRFKGITSNFAGGTINTSNVPDLEPVGDFGGTRTTTPRFMQGGSSPSGALDKIKRSSLDINPSSLTTMDVVDLMDMLSDAHPDLSFALWNFMRIASSDYTIEVTSVEGDDRDENAELEIKNFIKRLEQPNVFQFESSRSLDKVINQLIQSIVLRGAGAIELVTTPSYDDVAFIAPVDPATISFLFENDRYVPYQDEESISLDIPTFLYEALDERIDDPYGRSPFLSALNMILFQMQVLNDIKAVVHNQGYPRFDITVLEDVLLKRMPIGIRNNEKEKQKWLNSQLENIIEAYSGLDPDDAFVHYNSIEVGMAGGGKSTGALIDPQKLMTVIDNMIMSGLKTLSTILGRRSTGNTESFAKMELKMYMRGVEAIQNVVERLMSRALTLLLNIRGMQGCVSFKFQPVEIRTELEKAQFEQIALMNYAYMRDQGWIDQDEASRRATGTPAVAEPDWEHLGGSSAVKNKDGETITGSKDENPNASSEGGREGTNESSSN